MRKPAERAERMQENLVAPTPPFSVQKPSLRGTAPPHIAFAKVLFSGGNDISLRNRVMNPNADEAPPVTFPHHVLVRSSSFGLALLYILITLVTLFQIIRILCYRHNLLHYQFFFLLLCLIWSIIRSIFWILNPWAPFLENVLQFFAIWAQFAMFAFLVLFFVQVVYKAEGWWMTFRVRVFVVYTAVVSLFFFIYVAILVASVEWGSNSPKTDKVGLGFVALMFLLLSASLVYYMYKMWILKSSIKPQLPHNRTKLHILLITITLVVVFLSRSLKAIISIFGVGVIAFTLDMPTSTQLIVFFLYLAWEVVPLSLVLLLFWHIPRTQKLLWGKFNAPFGNDIPNLAYAYDSDIRTRAINDGSTTDDTVTGWDGVNTSPYTDIPQSATADYDDPATPIIVNTPSSFSGSFPGSFPSSLQGHTKLTPYNTKSPLLSSRR